MVNKRKLGTDKEELAAAYLREQGAEILAKNYYFHGGELDLIAKDGEYLCFVEVKYRRNTLYGYPEEAVTIAKQRKILKGASFFLYQNRLPEDTPCRFDVISIYKDDITWIQNVFMTG